MTSLKNIGEKFEHEAHAPLIYGLPDDLAILCLSRVPRQFHHYLRCVCRRWRTLLCTEEWHFSRSSQNLRETWVYAMCLNKYRVNCCYVFDPSSLQWKLLEPIPPRCACREGMAFEALGNRLFLLGGSGCQESSSAEVYRYDTSNGKWEEAAKMPTPRCYSLSAALGNKIYVTGGLNMSSESSNSWDIYDSHLNTWSSYQDTSLIPDIVKSFVFEEKIYTIHNKSMHRQYARIFDPSSRKWASASQQMSSSAYGPTVAIRGILYMLDESYGTRLMMWRKESEKWIPLGRLAHVLTKPPCQLANVGNCIFIIGRNLSTVVVDTETAAQVEGILLAASFAPKLDDDLSVISCKTIAI